MQQVLVQQEVVQLPQPEVLPERCWDQEQGPRASAAEAPMRAVWAGTGQ